MTDKRDAWAAQKRNDCHSTKSTMGTATMRLLVVMATRRLHRHGTASERYDPRGVRHQTVVALLLVGN